MAVNFPGGPSNGQVFTSGGISWIYDSALGAWKIVPNTIVGTQGIQGFQGLQGTSIQGQSGTTQGIQGTQGFQGLQGISIQGSSGSSGSSTQLNATDVTTAATFYPVFVAAAGSPQTVSVTTTKLYFNPSTGDLSATNFNSLSDLKAKENFEPITDPFSILDKIDTLKFTWKDNGEISYGMIAQELEKVMPELVKENPSGQKTVNYIPLIAILIEAVKQLRK
jgi:hypothetical protein